MGKSSKPAYSSGVVTINGEEKASQYKNGNTVYSNYNMSDAEKQIYDYAQNSFLENLPKVNMVWQTLQEFNFFELIGVCFKYILIFLVGIC